MHVLSTIQLRKKVCRVKSKCKKIISWCMMHIHHTPYIRCSTTWHGLLYWSGVESGAVPQMIYVCLSMHWGYIFFLLFTDQDKIHCMSIEHWAYLCSVHSLVYYMCTNFDTRTKNWKSWAKVIPALKSISYSYVEIHCTCLSIWYLLCVSCERNIMRGFLQVTETACSQSQDCGERERKIEREI